MADVLVGRRAKYGEAGLAASLRLGSVLAIFVLWVVSSWLAERSFGSADAVLPYPWTVAAAFPRLAVFLGPGEAPSFSGALQVLAVNSLDSLLRLLGGLSIGAVLGVGAGLLLGLSPAARRLLQLPFLLLRTIPLLALIPLFLAWFGGAQAGIVAYVAFGVFSMLLVNTLSAIENVSPVVQSFAFTLGATRLHVYRTVVLPAMLPELVGGVRVVVGMAWALLIGGELLGAQTGVGRILSLAAQFSDTGRMIIIVALLVIYTIVLDQLLARVLSYFTRWAPGSQR